VSVGRNESDSMTQDAELNQAEQWFYEGFCRERAVRYKIFEGIDGL
jgi:hypothetical protein